MLANIFDIIPNSSDKNNYTTICNLQAFSEICFPLASMIITTFVGVIAFITTKHEEIYLKYKNLRYFQQNNDFLFHMFFLLLV